MLIHVHTDTDTHMHIYILDKKEFPRIGRDLVSLATLITTRNK